MTFLQDTFQYLNEHCRYAVLRSYDELPDAYESHDIDMIMTEAEYDRLRAELYRIAEKHEYKLIQYYRDERFVTIFFQKVTEDTSDILELDFFFAMSAKGILMMDAEEILKNRCFNGKVYHVSLVDEVLDKCLCNGVFGVSYPEKYLCRYHQLTEEQHLELNEKLQYVFGKVGRDFPTQQRIDGKHLAKLAMRYGFKHRGFQQWRFCFRHWICVIQNLIFPRGIFMSFTGPDGSGKTTVLDNICASYESVFRGSIQLEHFRPDVLPRLALLFHRAGLKKTVDEEYDKPHRGKPSGTLGSLVRLFYYIFDYQIGYLSKIRMQLFRRRVVIYDRYYTDIVVDGARSNIGLSYKLIDKLGFLVPQPKYVAFLTAKPETIRGRKKELTEEEISTINERLHSINKKRKSRIFYNESTPQCVSCEIMSWVLEKQDERLRKYMSDKK